MGDLGPVPAFTTAGAGPWWSALEFDEAPKITARLPFVERADHPAGLSVFVLLRRRGGLPGAKLDYSVLEESADAIIEALVLQEYRQRYEIVDEDAPP
jgi:hypothetical protein